jgi:hypothetical protein
LAWAAAARQQQAPVPLQQEAAAEPCDESPEEHVLCALGARQPQVLQRADEVAAEAVAAEAAGQRNRQQHTELPQRRFYQFLFS